MVLLEDGWPGFSRLWMPALALPGVRPARNRAVLPPAPPRISRPAYWATPGVWTFMTQLTYRLVAVFAEVNQRVNAAWSPVPTAACAWLPPGGGYPKDDCKLPTPEETCADAGSSTQAPLQPWPRLKPSRL